MINYNEKLSQEQMLICESEKNLLVKACPGSGKTRTIVYKLAYRIEKNPNNIKKLIAITYTNRAANEIMQRIEELGIDTERVWTGTIHQFCLEWILKRYKMYTRSLSQGFKIIDERVKERYLSETISALFILAMIVPQILMSTKQNLSMQQQSFSLQIICWKHVEIGALNTNALAAADEVIITVNPRRLQ